MSWCPRGQSTNGEIGAIGRPDRVQVANALLQRATVLLFFFFSRVAMVRSDHAGGNTHQPSTLYCALCTQRDETAKELRARILVLDWGGGGGGGGIGAKRRAGEWPGELTKGKEWDQGTAPSSQSRRTRIHIIHSAGACAHKNPGPMLAVFAVT